VLNPSLGQIVLISAVLDPNGRNPKDRPAIILALKGDPGPNRRFLAMAVTTWIPDPLPDDYILLPWQAPYHPRTGLSKRCAAVGTWLTIVGPERMVRQIGFVPGRQRAEILAFVQRLRGVAGWEIAR